MFELAERIKYINIPEVGELLKLASKPGIISLAGGVPAPELFPVGEMKEISCKILENEGFETLQYNPTDGYFPLREEIGMHLMDYQAHPDEIIITSGSQQGLDFSTKLFVNPGDAIICEAPTFLGAIGTFKAYEPHILEMATDENGMIIEEVEKVIIKNGKVKMIYVIPDFQNPSGKTWSVERRKGLLKLAEKYNIPIIEDSPYRDLRFDGEPKPSIKSMDKNGKVIYLGSFSKTLSPGLRVGWICAPREIIDKYNQIKSGTDLHTNGLAQRQVYEFVTRYDYKKHIAKLNETYKKRRDVMLECIKKYFPTEIKYTKPEGGLFIWVTLPEGINTRAVALTALENKVAFIVGGAFYSKPGTDNSFRLNYTSMNEEKIDEGMRRLGDVLKGYVKWYYNI